MNRLIRFTPVLLLALVGCIPYRKGRFHGPATVTDSGFFSYYRYHFRFFPPMPLREPGVRTYEFRGMPKELMTISFAVEPFKYSDYNKVQSLTTILSVELHDDYGTLICSGAGSLSTWVLAAGGNEAEFWRPACTDVKFRRGHSYVLNVKIGQPDPRTPEISIRPWIDGGGIELP